MFQFDAHMGKLADPDARDKTDYVEEYLKLSREFADIFLPGLDVTEPVLMDRCLYTENIDDGDTSWIDTLSIRR